MANICPLPFFPCKYLHGFSGSKSPALQTAFTTCLFYALTRTWAMSDNQPARQRTGCWKVSLTEGVRSTEHVGNMNNPSISEETWRQNSEFKRLGFRRSFLAEILHVCFLRPKGFYTFQDEKTTTFFLTRSHNYPLLAQGKLKHRQAWCCAYCHVPIHCQGRKGAREPDCQWSAAIKAPVQVESEYHKVIYGGVTYFLCWTGRRYTNISTFTSVTTAFTLWLFASFMIWAKLKSKTS